MTRAPQRAAWLVATTCLVAALSPVAVFADMVAPAPPRPANAERRSSWEKLARAAEGKSRHSETVYALAGLFVLGTAIGSLGLLHDMAKRRAEGEDRQ